MACDKRVSLVLFLVWLSALTGKAAYTATLGLRRGQPELHIKVT